MEIRLFEQKYREDIIFMILEAKKIYPSIGFVEIATYEMVKHLK